MNIEYTKCLDNLNLKVEDELFDFIHSGHDNTADYCLESADSSDDVIYYCKATSHFDRAPEVTSGGPSAQQEAQ